MLNEMFERQKEFIKKWTDFERLKNDHIYKQKQILKYIDCSVEELIELRRECPYRKDWKSNRLNPIDVKKLKEEYIDALHFIINLGIVIGFESAEEIFEEYQKKHQINIDRQNNSY